MPLSSQVKVAHNRLSFGEELDEEGAQPDGAFSLAESTVNRCVSYQLYFILKSIRHLL